jgi:hypothetical protein
MGHAEESTPVYCESCHGKNMERGAPDYFPEGYMLIDVVCQDCGWSAFEEWRFDGLVDAGHD